MLTVTLGDSCPPFTVMSTAAMAPSSPVDERTVWMSVNGRNALAPKLNDAELSSLREFWDVYETQFAEIGSEIAQDAAAHPELANFVGAGEGEEVDENRERIAQAINDGDWAAYLSDMVENGNRYAEAGLSFSGRQCAACRSSSTS